jgi:hypothetical protein
MGLEAGLAPQTASIETQELMVSGQNWKQNEGQVSKSPGRKHDFNTCKSRDPEEIMSLCKFYIAKLKSIKKSTSKEANPLSPEPKGDLNKQILYQLSKMNQRKLRHVLSPGTAKTELVDKTEQNEDSVSNLLQQKIDQA